MPACTAVIAGRYPHRQRLYHDEAMKEVKMVVEGVYSAKAALKLAEKYHVTMPIVEQVNDVLFDGKSAKRCPGRADAAG